MAIGPLQLIRQATTGRWRTLLAASMGWALDAFDAMLYSLMLALLMRDLGMTKTVGGTGCEVFPTAVRARVLGFT